MILFPNAKINIGLNIVSKRSDGFHNLETIMYPIPLTDIITVNPLKNSNKGTKIKFSATGIFIDGEPQENLIFKAFRLLDDDFHLPGTEVHLHKSIPFGAGLGGGSADGAFMIKALNDLYKLNLSTETMESYAAKLGSDCAFFIENKPALATGRGEILEPININLSKYKIVIVIPPDHISTKEAYQFVSPHSPKYNIKDYFSKPITEWKNYLVNDFELSVFSQKPEIAQVKHKLYDAGAIYASLSGSGAATFGIFDSLPDLRKIFPKNYFTWHSK